jgi:hypothetical protein
MPSEENVKSKKKSYIDPSNFTKATTFILPMLNNTRMFYGDRIYNCYVSVNPERIYIVFKEPFSSLDFEYTFAALRAHEEYSREETHGDYLIMEFFIPPLYLDDFYTFLDSKYSKFTDFYKEEILASHISWDRAYENVSRILFPTKKEREQLEKNLNLDWSLPKDAEIYSAINLRKEIFDKDKLI